MKLTIWQQFSSNHSSHFHIVGVFDTSAAAQKAADELRQIFKQIEDWHEQNPDKSEALFERWRSGDYPRELSEIEQMLAQKYSVKWPSGIEWYWNTQIEFLLGHIIHISTRSQIRTGPEPFGEIIERLGGYGLVAGESEGGYEYGTIKVHLSCIAPDIHVAQAIVKEYALNRNENVIQPLTYAEHVSNYGTKLNFGWDFNNGFWKLDKLVQELKDKKCTEIEYSFYGTRSISTIDYKLDDKK